MKKPYSNWHNKFALMWVVILMVAATILGSLWWQHKIAMQSDIFSLLPKQQQAPAVADAKDHIAQLLNRQLFVMVSAPSPEQLQQESQHVLKRFEQSDLWQLPPTGALEQVGKTLFAHKTGLLSADDAQHLQQQNYSALTDAALMQLVSPAMPITDALLEEDPLLLFPRYLMALQTSSHQDIQLQDGFPSRELGGLYHRLLTIELTHSPFDIAYQEQTLPWLEALQKTGLMHPDSQIHLTGTLVYASAGTKSAQTEISTIGLGSSIGIVLLVWFGFRSFRPLVTEFAAVGSGCLLAFLSTHLIFGEVHVMTMVFGASLIGASVDFSFYYLFMQSHQRHRSGAQVMHDMLPDLFIGLMTTLAAYVSLLLTPFPGLRQIAVFSMIGLSAAWLTSMLLLPYLKPLDTRACSQRLQVLSSGRQAFLQKSWWRWSCVGVCLLMAAVWLPQLTANDDVRNLQAADPHWQQQEAHIKQVFGQQQTGQFVVVHAANDTETAQHEAQLIALLRQAQSQQLLGDFQALGTTLPTVAQQQAHVKLLQSIPDGVLQDYALQTGLAPQALEHWQQQLANAQWLTAEHVREHPASQLRVNAQTRIVLLHDIHQPEALKQLLAPLTHITWVHPTEDLSQMFQTYRSQSTERLLWALLALGVILGLIYGPRAVFGLMAPVSLGLLSAFALQAALGMPINLFSIMAAFLVLGIGVDYAIFYHHTPTHAPVVSSALFLCMIASILGFGLLALSQTQAIRSFGLTVLLGVMFSYFYANVLTFPKSHFQKDN